jgi:hypothetical protein
MVTVGDVLSLFAAAGIKSGMGLDEALPLVKQGFDSLDVLTLILEVEKVYKVRIPEEKAEELRSVRNIVDFLNSEGIVRNG